MSLYRELRPDPANLPIEIAMTSLEQSRRALTRPFGQAIVTNGAGGTSILGAGGGDGLIPWVDDSEPPSRPTGLSAASTSQVITVHWDGTLEYGLPADFHSIEIHIQPDGGDDTVIGTLRVAGDVASGLLTEGAIVDVWAVALDDAHDRVGEWTPNRSEASDVITLVVEPVVSQGQLKDKADEILAAADESVKAQIERVDTDLAATNEAIDRKAGETLAAANAAAEANLNRVQEEIAGEGGRIDQAANAAYDRAKEHADALKAQVDAEFVAADKKISDTANSAYERAKDYTDGIKAQVDSDLVATGEAIDAAADKALADAKADTAQHVAQVKEDIHDANEQIAANKTAVETEARLRAEGDRLAQEAAAAVKAETDKLVTKYDEMDTSVTSVKNDLKNVMTSTTQLEQDMIVSTLIEYAVGDSDTVPPTLAAYWLGEPNNSVSVLSDPWGPTTPERTPGTYIWMRTRVTFGDGGQETSAPVLVTGNTGAQGPQGVAGAKGDKGEDGVTRYSYFAYGTSASGANFSTTPTSASTYIGVCVTTAATQPTDPTKYTWSLTKGATGPAGPQGAAGAKGDVGEDGKTYYTYFAYGTSASGANFSTTPTANSTYMGVCITLDATQPTTPASYTWSLTKGNTGATGAQGVSVSALTPFWQMSESKPAQPVNKTPGGGWSSTEPAYVRGKKLWTCSRIDYSNGQWSWTSVQQSSAFDAAELALTTANGKNRRYVQQSTPVVDASELTQGDEWWQTSSKPPETYWMGEPDNSVSVLVDHSGEVEHIWVWNGSRWALNRLSAEDILVSHTVAAGLVTADFFDGARIKGGEFLTSNELIRLNNAGLVMDGKSGERLVTLNATDGTATFNSVAITNGALSAGTIDSAAINGGSFTLRDKDGRAIGHLNSSGMDLGDVFAFAKKNGEWLLSIKGSIRAGSTISGASIVGDSTVTGGVVQTSAEDRRGIKLTGGNLDIYRSDKTRFMRANENGLYISDGSKNVLSFSRVLRTYWLGEPNNSVSVLSEGWQLTLDGAIQSGGEITGAVITGGTVQTNAAANRGIKLADSNLDAYTAAGSRFLRLNEAGMWFKDGDANALSFVKDSTGRMVLTIRDAIQTDGAINGATVTGCVVQTVAADKRGIKLKDNNLDVFSAAGKLVMQANEAGISFKDAAGADKATFSPDANGVWNLRLTGMVSTGGAINGGTVTGSMVQTTASANHGVKMYSGDTTTGNLDVYRADGQLFLRANEDGLSVKDGDTNLLSFAKVNNAWKLSLKGAIQSGGEISGAAITGAAIRTNTEWQSSEAAKKYRGLVITDGGMFAYKNNGKEEYSMAFTAATGELKLDGAIATNASLTAPRITGGVVSTASSFDIQDGDGDVITSLVPYGINIPGTDEYNHAQLRVSPQGLSITSSYNDVTNNVDPDLADMYTAETTFAMGRGGVSMNTYWTDMAMGQAGISLIARRYGWPTGFAIENGVNGININHPQYGHLQIGANGLSLVNDQGWGLSLSVSGWSLKWAGNHTLATGPTAGALYIDGKEIKTV